MKSFSIIDIPLCILSREELTGRIEEMLRSDQLHMIVTVNPEFVVEAHHNKAYRRVLKKADLATVDGTGIVYAAKLQGIKASLKDRITGVELTYLLLARAERDQSTVAILLKHNSLSDPSGLQQKLQNMYPHVKAYVFREPVTIDQIQSVKPKILFVALGSPTQEDWIQASRAHFSSVRIALGVGGTFDFISGKIQRAPAFMRTVGLEWLWRLVLEPKRLPRILRATIVFPYLALINRNEKSSN